MEPDRLDDHLVEPETRWEVIDGAHVHTPPAEPPQADRHFTMNYVIGAHLAPGYLGASDLLTRWSSDEDYATDTSVRRAGTDEATGERYLEELVFDVLGAQQREDLENRARSMSRRGVRRIFAVFVKEGRLEEWSHEDETWKVLDAQQRARIDTCADPDILTEWLCRALTATQVDEIFLDRADD